VTGTLTLVRPKPGVVTTFDAREYSLIDFVPIEYQWTALVQVGTLDGAGGRRIRSVHQ